MLTSGLLNALKSSEGLEQMDELKLIISSFANSALRTLCFGFRELLNEELEGLSPENIKANGLPESNLICIAIVGIKDPCRPGVPEAVARCQAAGIKVCHAIALFIYTLSQISIDHSSLDSQVSTTFQNMKSFFNLFLLVFALIFLVLAYSEVHVQVRMVTGDNVQTAKAIAAECGILTPNGIAIEGKDFRVMTVQEQYDLLPSVDVRLRFFTTLSFQCFTILGSIDYILSYFPSGL